MTETYTSILAELLKRRDALTAELSGVNSAIAAIMPLVPSETRVPAVFSRPVVCGERDALAIRERPVSPRVVSRQRRSAYLYCGACRTMATMNADAHGGSEGPPCPECGHGKSRVLQSRSNGSDDFRRRRECANPDCRCRFTTYEILRKTA